MRLWGAWILKIDGTHVSTVLDAQAVFPQLLDANVQFCTLLASHREVIPDISNRGILISPRLISPKSCMTHLTIMLIS
jgi:hypothetical protein